MNITKLEITGIISMIRTGHYHVMVDYYPDNNNNMISRNVNSERFVPTTQIADPSDTIEASVYQQIEAAILEMLNHTHTFMDERGTACNCDCNCNCTRGSL